MTSILQTALISGGSSGLGRAFAVELARRGYRVAIAARTPMPLAETARIIEEAGGTVLPIQADVTSRSAVDLMVERTEAAFGSIDLLINNAGVFQALGEFSKLDPDAWWREVEINLRGPMLCAHAVLPGMIKRERGRIINMASMAGLFSLETVSAYCVSKAALIRFTESLALETKPHNIAVFAAHPGTVRTPMSDYAATSAIVGRDAPGVQEYFRYLYESGQDTPIEKSVRLIGELASGRLDALSGCYIDVDADLDELIARADAIQEEGKLKLRLAS